MREEKFNESYSDWKKWSWKHYADLTGSTKRYFEGENKKLNLSKNTRILEIGFGEGEFLEWAKNRGYKVSGIELIDSLVERARNEGFCADSVDLCVEGNLSSDFIELDDNSYDVIIAFDVVEHMEPLEFRQFLKNASRLLSPRGAIMARVPNSGSLLGLRLQNGDQTHKISFTLSKMRQLLVNSGFEVKYCENSFRVTGNSWFSPLLAIVFPLRWLLEVGIGSLYFTGRIPLDPALTFILRKTQQAHR